MRKKLITVAGVLLGAACLHTAAWFLAVGRAQTELLAWVAQRRAQGWTVEFGAPRHAGWPLAAIVAVPDVSMVVPVAATPVALRLRVETVALGVRLLEPLRLRVGLQGALHLQLGDGPELAAQAAQLEVSVSLRERDSLSGLEIVSTDLQLGPPQPWLTVARARLRVSWHPAGDTALSLSLEAGPASLAAAPQPGMPAWLWALGPTIDRVALDARLGGGLPLRVAPGGGLAGWAGAWRDGGGRAFLQLAALDWGPVSASGSASAGLDSALQPAGTANLKLVGFAAGLDAMAAAHVLPQRTAATAKAVLTLLARPQPDGRPAVETPLSVENGLLQVGRIPLARMPQLQWSTAP